MLCTCVVIIIKLSAVHILQFISTAVASYIHSSFVEMNVIEVCIFTAVLIRTSTASDILIFMFYPIIHLTSVVTLISVQHSVNTYWIIMVHCLSHQMLSIISYQENIVLMLQIHKFSKFFASGEI